MKQHHHIIVLQKALLSNHDIHHLLNAFIWQVYNIWSHENIPFYVTVQHVYIKGNNNDPNRIDLFPKNCRGNNKAQKRLVWLGPYFVTKLKRNKRTLLFHSIAEISHRVAAGSQKCPAAWRNTFHG